MKKCDISEYKLNVRDLQIIEQALREHRNSWMEDLEEQKKIYYKAANRKDSILPADQEKESKTERAHRIYLGIYKRNDEYRDKSIYVDKLWRLHR